MSIVSHFSSISLLVDMPTFQLLIRKFSFADVISLIMLETRYA